MRPSLSRVWRWPILAAVVLAAAALILAPVLFAKLTAERAQRQQVVSQVISLDCNTNNDQDKLLARLIEASIASAGTSFGENVDPSTLTPFDVAVLRTIAKVATSGDDANLTSKFKRVLGKLRDLTPCQAVVASYLAGEPISATPDTSAPAAVGDAVRHGLHK